MKPVALVLFLPALAACGGAAPRTPEVSVGTSPVEVKAAPEPVELPREDADEAALRRGNEARLLLTDGEGHRFEVETIPTLDTSSR